MTWTSSFPFLNPRKQPPKKPIALNDFMSGKFLTMGVSMLLGVGTVAQGEEYNLMPQTITGWGAILATVILFFWHIIDRRKIAQANAFQEIIDGKDKLIKHHEEMSDKWEKEYRTTQDELDKYRKIHHDFITSAQNIFLEHAAMKMIFAEKGLTLPAEINELPKI